MPKLYLNLRAGFLMPEKLITPIPAGSTKKWNHYTNRWKDFRMEQRRRLYKKWWPIKMFITQKLVITAGAWASQLMNELNIPLRVTRRVLIWTEPEEPGYFFRRNFLLGGRCKRYGRVWYGFPYLQNKKYPRPSGLKFNPPSSGWYNWSGYSEPGYHRKGNAAYMWGLQVNILFQHEAK